MTVGARILVADDQPEHRSRLVQMLQHEGFRVQEAANGAEAWAIIQHEPPDLLLLDLRMPVLDGFAVLERLEQREGIFLPVIVVASSLEREACLRALRLGAHEFVRTPIDADELTARVRTLLSLKEARDDAVRRASECERKVKDRTQKLVEAHHQLEATHHRLADAYNRLKETDRYKDEFLSIISHELRTPLNFITGFASLLEDGIAGELTPAQRDYVAKILDGAERMIALVNDLLDVAKIQAGKLDYAPRPVPYAPVVREAVASMRPLAERKGLELKAEIEVEATLRIDPMRINQLLTNLLSNAIKFTQPGGTVTVRVLSEGSDILTQVIDTGKGIATQDMARLFRKFRQLDMSTTREAGGTGLGLVICKAIVRAHGGRIGVHSVLGQGSTFWFTLRKRGAPPPHGEAPPHGVSD